MGEERPWEKSYPPGVRWDAPIETAPLPAMFDAFTAKWAPKTALEYRDRTISAAELRGAVDAVASGLMDLGVNPGTAVAFSPAQHPYHPISLRRASNAAGARAFSPLDAERACFLKDAGARVLVTTNIGFMALMAQKLKADGLIDHLVVADDTAFGSSPTPTTPIADDGSVVRFDTLRAAGAGQLPRQWPKTSVEDIALLQYTGGTTGKPKGAMLTHGNLSAACSIYKLWGDPQRISAPGEDKVICVLPLFHIFALTSVMLRGLSEGNELLLRVRFDVGTTLNDIEVKKVTVFAGVPTMWIALANTPGIDKRDFSSLRYAASGGAALPSMSPNASRS
jgi:long-chain acyl-CoA synthetase